MASIKKNFISNIILTMSTYIVNLLIFPIVSRALGVEMVGRVGFVVNIVNYFSLFAILGITSIGIREIAGCKGYKEKRSKVFSEILSLTAIFTSLSVVVYLILIFTVPRLHQYYPLFLVGVSNLIFTSFLIEWFYQGMEEFAYITYRSLIIKFIYAVAIILLIHNPSDYFLYYCIVSLSVVINSTINLIHARKYVRFSFKNIEIRKYLKSVVSLGAYKIMTSMYTTFNVLFLGFVCSEVIVGYYYTSTKIFYIILGIMSAFTHVMLPRMSSLLASNNISEFQSKAKSSFDVMFGISIPLAIGGLIMAPEIIGIISGHGFEGAITPMRIIMPVIILSSIAQIFVIQVLIPYKKDNVILNGAIAGAIVGIITNILLVKQFGAVGSAIALLSAEIANDIVVFRYVSKSQLLQFPTSSFFKTLMVCLPYIAICLLCKFVFDNKFASLFVAALGCGIYMVISYQFILKDTVIHDTLITQENKIKQKISNYVHF